MKAGKQLLELPNLFWPHRIQGKGSNPFWACSQSLWQLNHLREVEDRKVSQTSCYWLDSMSVKFKIQKHTAKLKNTLNERYRSKSIQIWLVKTCYYLHAVGFGTIGDSFSGPSNRVINWKQVRKVAFQANIAEPGNRSSKGASRHPQTGLTITDTKKLCSVLVHKYFFFFFFGFFFWL